MVSFVEDINIYYYYSITTTIIIKLLPFHIYTYPLPTLYTISTPYSLNLKYPHPLPTYPCSLPLYIAVPTIISLF